jgi:hypothetical protein|tara:strand:- start:2153 stop:2413 length:261 start_codon:yes stop_codon:yes gene_type:complete
MAKDRLTGINEHTLASIDRYINNKISGGDFLDAVFSNDLMESFARADEQNRQDMFEIVSYLYNHAPMECWGSREKVKLWLKGGEDE